jgi:transposase
LGVIDLSFDLGLNEGLGPQICGVEDTELERPRVEHHGSAGTAMLGLEGFVLGTSMAFGELEQVIETTASEACCLGCGVVAKPHVRRCTTIRDLPSAGRPVTLVWLKRLWRCLEPACEGRTWSETCVDIRPRSSMTERARREACRLAVRTSRTSPPSR